MWCGSTFAVTSSSSEPRVSLQHLCSGRGHTHPHHGHRSWMHTILAFVLRLRARRMPSISGQKLFLLKARVLLFYLLMHIFLSPLARTFCPVDKMSLDSISLGLAFHFQYIIGEQGLQAPQE